IKNLKIDKITVWDSGAGSEKGSSSTANFLSSMIKSLPPLQEIANMAGVELPEYLGKMVDSKDVTEAEKSAKPVAKKAAPAKTEPAKDKPAEPA
ncbi:MAG: flotillin family protein, partial [Planctomycetota bacterium]